MTTLQTSSPMRLWLLKSRSGRVGWTGPMTSVPDLTPARSMGSFTESPAVGGETAREVAPR